MNINISFVLKIFNFTDLIILLCTFFFFLIIFFFIIWVIRFSCVKNEKHAKLSQWKKGEPSWIFNFVNIIFLGAFISIIIYKFCKNSGHEAKHDNLFRTVLKNLG